MVDRIMDAIFLDEELREEAMQRAADKHVPIWTLRKMCDKRWWADVMERMANGTLHAQPPYTLKIPKDDGDWRIVKANRVVDKDDPRKVVGDRVIFIMIYLWIVRNTDGMTHPNCFSYQEGQSTKRTVAKIVREVSDALRRGLPVIKVDFTKYFDRMPRWIIRWALNMIEMQWGKSKVIDYVWEYYQLDEYWDSELKEMVTEYSGLKQGCTIAAWLANVCMYHLDERLSHLNIKVYRYCDDMLLVGEEAEQGLEIIRETMVALSSTENGKEYDMQLKEKKTQRIDTKKFFTFLGYNIKSDMMTFSAKFVHGYQHDMLEILRTATPENVVRKVNAYLHGGEYPRFERIAHSTSEQDIRTLDMFTRDIIRAVKLDRRNVGRLGCNVQRKGGAIQYSIHGTQCLSNYERMPHVDGYRSMWCLVKNRRCGKNVYEAEARALLS